MVRGGGPGYGGVALIGPGTRSQDRVRIVAADSTFRGRTGTVEETYTDDNGRPKIAVRPESDLFVMPVLGFSPEEVETLRGGEAADPSTA